MHILESRSDTKLILQLNGRLNINTAPKLESAINGIDGEITELELDFSQLDYISSAGLRVILMAQNQMSAKGGMIVRNVNKKVMAAFEITGFTNILTIQNP